MFDFWPRCATCGKPMVIEVLTPKGPVHPSIECGGVIESLYKPETNQNENLIVDRTP